MNPLCFGVEKGEPPSLGPLPTSRMNTAALEHAGRREPGGDAEVCCRDVSTRGAELWSWGRERTSPGKKKPSSQGRTRGCWRQESCRGSWATQEDAVSIRRSPGAPHSCTQACPSPGRARTGWSKSALADHAAVQKPQTASQEVLIAVAAELCLSKRQL